MQYHFLYWDIRYNPINWGHIIFIHKHLQVTLQFKIIGPCKYGFFSCFVILNKPTTYNKNWKYK